jgi:chromosome segregation ATPase
MGGGTVPPADTGWEVIGLRQELETLRREFDRTRQEYKQNLASHDETVARIEADTRELQTSLRGLEELKQQVGDLTRRRASQRPNKPPTESDKG